MLRSRRHSGLTKLRKQLTEICCGKQNTLDHQKSSHPDKNNNNDFIRYNPKKKLCRSISGDSFIQEKATKSPSECSRYTNFFNPFNEKNTRNSDFVTKLIKTLESKASSDAYSENHDYQPEFGHFREDMYRYCQLYCLQKLDETGEANHKHKEKINSLIPDDKAWKTFCSAIEYFSLNIQFRIPDSLVDVKVLSKLYNQVVYDVLLEKRVTWGGIIGIMGLTGSWVAQLVSNSHPYEAMVILARLKSLVLRHYKIKNFLVGQSEMHKTNKTHKKNSGKTSGKECPKRILDFHKSFEQNGHGR